MADARLKSICEQRNMFYGRISGLHCTTYNHFTQQNDIFLHLTNRLIVIDDKNIGEKYKDVTSTFSDTFITILNGGKEYVLQRDLYAAAKMIYCIPKEVKNGRKKSFVWEFDQKGFEKFFEEKFYPKHLEYIRKLIEQKKMGIQLSGTILGG